MITSGFAPVTRRLIEDVRSGNWGDPANAPTKGPIQAALDDVRAAAGNTCQLCGSDSAQLSAQANTPQPSPGESDQNMPIVERINLDPTAIMLLREAITQISRLEGRVQGILEFLCKDHPGAWHLSDCGTAMLRD